MKSLALLLASMVVAGSAHAAGAQNATLAVTKHGLRYLPHHRAQRVGAGARRGIRKGGVQDEAGHRGIRPDQGQTGSSRQSDDRGGLPVDREAGSVTWWKLFWNPPSRVPNVDT